MNHGAERDRYIRRRISKLFYSRSAPGPKYIENMLTQNRAVEGATIEQHHIGKNRPRSGWRNQPLMLLYESQDMTGNGRIALVGQPCLGQCTATRGSFQRRVQIQLWEEAFQQIVPDHIRAEFGATAATNQAAAGT